MNMVFSKEALFFGWDRPWLPRLASYLLNEWKQEQKTVRGDLSKTIVILPGRRAGRRLLELLALQAAEEKITLLPPRMVTLREAISLLLIPEGKLLPEAGEWTCRFAWQEAFQRLSPEQLQKIQLMLTEMIVSKTGEQLSGLVSLVEELAQELGSVGLDFSKAAARVTSFFPEAAEREEARWQALTEVQHLYRRLLASWGYSDPMDALCQRLEEGVLDATWHVLAAGIIEENPLWVSLFKKANPTIIIIAPEEHAAGFTKEGTLLASYWLAHPPAIEESQFIPCEQAEEQVSEVARLLAPLHHSCHAATVAVPDVTLLPLLQDHLKQGGIQTRWAGGRPFLGGRLHQLLHALADFFDRRKYPGPSLAAVGALVRHPDIQPHCSAPEKFLLQLDALERAHLPPFLDKKSLSLFKKNGALISWIEELETISKIKKTEPLLLAECAEELRALLLRLLGKRYVHGDTAEGHYFLGCLEECLLLLEEVEVAVGSMSLRLSMTDFIKKLLDLLTKKKIPEQEKPEAVELLGWLEIAADDAPCVIITSCHEGFLPRSQHTNPLLPQALRKCLGLPHETTLLAWDHYLLQTIVASRQTILMASRYNGRGEPVRPSRLLTLGASLEKLPERVLSLTRTVHSDTNESAADARQDLQHISLFGARSVEAEEITAITVTGLRTYLQSPRLFYLQHVLKLREMEEVSPEMHAGHFGIIIHAVLEAFGREKKLAQEIEAPIIATWLRKKLFAVAHRYFAPGPTQPIKLQLEEAAQALEGFAMAQAAHCRAGWKIIAAENSEVFSQLLEEKIEMEDGRTLLLQGRIDRIDWHPEQQRWMIIDYKTWHRQDWKKATPDKEHFQKKGEEVIWKDLQLPLYLKLATQWRPVQQSGLPLPAIDNTDLCYFYLPIESEKAGLSEPFSSSMVLPAWQEATCLMIKILDHHFEDVGEIDVKRMPTLSALCGKTVLYSSQE